LIKVRPDKIHIEMSIDEAKSLRHYLANSVLIDGEDVFNPIASAAVSGIKWAEEAMYIRQVLVGCLEFYARQ